MKTFNKLSAAIVVSLFLYANSSFAADTCQLNTSDAKFRAEVYKLAAKNNPARKSFDEFKDYFGLSKTAVDLVNNLNVGKFTKELQFIHTWHANDKILTNPTWSGVLAQQKVYIGPGGQPPGFVSKAAGIMGDIGNGLTALSLAINVYDMYNGDNKAYKAAVVDVYKTSQGLLVAKYGTQSLSAAMVGVGFMDYALNKYMKTAYAKYEDYWWQGYDTYLKRTYSRASWAKLYETQGEKGVDARLREFWENAYIEVGAHNQGKKTLATSADALALVDYPEPFAARYMSETLVPGLGQYYKEKAEEAALDLELFIDGKCDILIREMGKIKELEKAINIARIEMEKQDKAEQKEKQISKERRQYIVKGIADNSLHLPMGMSIDDAYNIGIKAAEHGQDYYKTIDRLDTIAQEQAEQREESADIADTDLKPESVQDTSEETQKDNEFMQNMDAIAAMIEAEKRGELDPEGQKILADLFGNSSTAETGTEDTVSEPVSLDKVLEKEDEDEGDDWDDIDEVDNLVVSNVSDEQKWVIRDQMAAQQDADRAKSDSQANQSFVAIEQQREEEARRKEQARREFAAGMQALAQGLGQVAQGIQEAERQNAIAAQENRDQVNSAMEDYQQKVQSSGYNKSCVNDLMSRRNFPITDPYLARSMCGKSSQSQYKPPAAKPKTGNTGYKPRTLYNTKIDRGNQTCAQKSAGSKNPRRWTACCNNNGEMRYNAFSTPNGRAGVSAYRCMMPGKPDESKYMIRID